MCKNNIVIISNLEIKFQYYYNYNNTTVIYIIFERGISFLIILKLFKISGLQTKMVFKQSFKYLKKEKN